MSGLQGGAMTNNAVDVIVVGAGLAGMTAALVLLDSGARVRLLDRDVRQNLGGLARESFGGMFVVDSKEQRLAGIRDSVELAWEDWQSYAEYSDADEWPRAWGQYFVENCRSRIYDWVKQQGVRFFPVPNWVERGGQRIGNRAPRFHMVWGTGQRLADVIAQHLLSHPQSKNLSLEFQHHVTDLQWTAGRVSGVVGVREDQDLPFEYAADTVILAAGGFNGNLERVRENWHADWQPVPQHILNGSHRFALGEMHDAAARAGGALSRMDSMWNYAAGVHHPHPRKPHHGLSLVPPRTALWLDATGQRIGPNPLLTGRDTRELVTAVCRTGYGYSWQVLNRGIALKELAVSGAEYNPAIRDRKWLAFLKSILLGNHWLVDSLTQDCPDFVVAHSLNELVEKMNQLTGENRVDLRRLQQAVEDFDHEVMLPTSAQTDPQLKWLDVMRQYRGDRVRLAKRVRLSASKAMPYIAIREHIISRKSLGGLQTNLQGQVLTPGGRPLTGLYAIGETAGFGGGGMHGLRALEGTFLGGCILTARNAAEHIVATTL